MRQFTVLAVVFILLSACQTESTDFLITDHGAISNPDFINSASINDAIKACNEAGGGRVIIPPGTWITGTIDLLNNVELHLMNGAVLKGSTDIKDFTRGDRILGVINAFNARNISITGDGEINGNGTPWHDETSPHDAGDFDRKYIRQGEAYMKPGFDFSDGPIFKDIRPGMCIVLMHCEDVSMVDITIRDTPSWAVRIGDCDDVNVRGVSIHNNLLIPNSDGIHCTHSRNVRISDCDIRAGDDAIIVTGFGDDIGVHGGEGKDSVDAVEYYGNNTTWTENVTVTNCLLQSRSSGVRVGYGAYPIRNCIFSNLVIYDSNRGLGVFARDDASIENIYFDNIIIRNRLHSGHWWGNGEPVHVSTIPQFEDMDGGDISNIRFSNITADSETGMIVWGSDHNRISDIEFHDIDLHIHTSPLAASYGGNIDLRPALDDRHKLFESDLPGLYIQKTDGVNVRNFQLKWDSDVPAYHTFGIQLVEVTGFDIDEISKTPARPGSGLPAIKNN